MERLTMHTPDNFGYAEYQLKPGVDEQDAVSCLADYEDTGMEPEEITTAIDSAAKLIATMRNNKKAALWLKKYGPAEAGDTP